MPPGGRHNHYQASVTGLADSECAAQQPTTRAGQVFASIYRRACEQVSTNGRRRLRIPDATLNQPSYRLDQVAQRAAHAKVQRSRRFQSSHHNDATGITTGPKTLDQ